MPRRSLILVLLGALLLPTGAHAEEAPTEVAPAPPPVADKGEAERGAEAAPEEGDAPASDAEAGDDAATPIQEMVDALMPAVAEIRGLEWKRPVPAHMYSREQLVERMLGSLDEEYPPEERERDNRVLHRIGLLQPGESLVDMVVGMMKEMVAGFYDPEAGELFLIEGPVGDELTSTIIHELIHALDDQHYDLDAMEEPYKEDPDRQFAGRCLWEGCAVHAQHLYEMAHPEVAAAAMKQMAGDADAQAKQAEVLRSVPAYLLINTMLHYRNGPHLVGLAVGEDFPAGMKALFDSPPTTQEHFLHPERWLDPQRRDHPHRVDLPTDALVAALGEGAKAYYDMSIGELDLALYLDYFLGGRKGRLNMEDRGSGNVVVEQAHRASVGWDGAHVQYLEVAADKPLVVAEAMAFDTADDAQECFDAIAAAVRARFPDVPTPEAGASAPFKYETEHGHGRVEAKGPYLLWLDGAPADRVDATWEALKGTRFSVAFDDAGHAGRPEGIADPLEGCVVVDRRRGLGVRAAEGWQIAAAPPNPQNIFAIARKDGLNVALMVPEQGGTPGILAPMLEGQVPGFDPAGLKPAKVAGAPGVSFEIRQPGQTMRFMAGIDAVRMYIAIVRGPAEQVDASTESIQGLLDGIVSNPGY